MSEQHHQSEIYHITAQRLSDHFPSVSDALKEPDGLLAAGGDLSVNRLLDAYRQGIFPWFDDDQPILWWSPNPRTIFVPGQIHISRSLNKFLKRKPFTYSYDQNFENVIRACAAPRRDQPGTWLSEEMINAYCDLHSNGHAHSIECWDDSGLVGGLYGVAIGRVFFGESMFSHLTNSSKACLVKLSDDLKEWGYELFDCQVHSPHLGRMGANQINRETFTAKLDVLCEETVSSEAWQNT